MVYALVLALATTATDVVSCQLTAICQDGAPKSAWELPACSDYALDTALIDSMEQGDRSALELLRSRYSREMTWVEKHRIAEALLRKVPDDSVYWNELFEHARNILRFHTGDGYSDEFVAWCRERLYEPSDYASMAFGALSGISKDPRSRALLLKLLESKDSNRVYQAILGLAAQHDLNALSAIETTLERTCARDRCVVAFALADYADERADQLAFRYLGEELRHEYLRLRNAAAGR